MRNLNDLQKELDKVHEELQEIRSKQPHLRTEKWNELIRREHNIYININQLNNFKIGNKRKERG